MRFLPTDSPLALHQASTTHSYQVTAPPTTLKLAIEENKTAKPPEKQFFVIQIRKVMVDYP